MSLRGPDHINWSSLRHRNCKRMPVLSAAAFLLFGKPGESKIRSKGAVPLAMTDTQEEV
jgi:hypothetical protein